MKNTIIITGGAGFIGSHVVRLFVNKYPEYRIINVDKLTYAGNLANLKDIEDKPNYAFVRADICDFDTIYALMQREHVSRPQDARLRNSHNPSECTSDNDHHTRGEAK